MNYVNDMNATCWRNQTLLMIMRSQETDKLFNAEMFIDSIEGKRWFEGHAGLIL